MKKFSWLLLALFLVAITGYTVVSYGGTVNRSDYVLTLSTGTASRVLDNREKRKSISIKNLDSSTTVYFSKSSISVTNWDTTKNVSDVCAIPAGSSYNEEGEWTYSREMYMVAEPSAAAKVNVNVSERW